MKWGVREKLGFDTPDLKDAKTLLEETVDAILDLMTILIEELE